LPRLFCWKNSAPHGFSPRPLGAAGNYSRGQLGHHPPPADQPGGWGREGTPTPPDLPAVPEAVCLSFIPEPLLIAASCFGGPASSRFLPSRKVQLLLEASGGRDFLSARNLAWLPRRSTDFSDLWAFSLEPWLWQGVHRGRDVFNFGLLPPTLSLFQPGGRKCYGVRLSHQVRVVQPLHFLNPPFLPLFSPDPTSRSVWGKPGPSWNRVPVILGWVSPSRARRRGGCWRVRCLLRGPGSLMGDRAQDGRPSAGCARAFPCQRIGGSGLPRGK
jgi:hypothetical protein